jgi:hypothetical protein
MLLQTNTAKQRICWHCACIAMLLSHYREVRDPFAGMHHCPTFKRLTKSAEDSGSSLLH